MTPDAALRMQVYQEGQRAYRHGIPCPYSDWRANTWQKGFEAARQHAEVIAAESQVLVSQLHEEAGMIQYNVTDDPTEVGVYACRIEDPIAPGSGLLLDVFLMWYDGRWCYLRSDANYRGEVLGWVGPLQRRMA